MPCRGVGIILRSPFVGLHKGSLLGGYKGRYEKAGIYNLGRAGAIYTHRHIRGWEEFNKMRSKTVLLLSEKHVSKQKTFILQNFLMLIPHFVIRTYYLLFFV